MNQAPSRADHLVAATTTPGTVAITGASGFIGSHLTRYLRAHGWRVLRLVRRATQAPDEVSWSPEEGRVDGSRLDGVDALIHLAGEAVAGKRWTSKKKAAVRDSRIRGTSTLCKAVLDLATAPRVWLSASGIGYYGDRGAEVLTEVSAPGDDFLAQVCQAWEAATEPAKARTRVVLLRTGLVLHATGGALVQMVPIFRWGLGGRVGHGRQYVSWIALRDMLRAMEHCLSTAVSGPVNAVAPNPVSNREFTQALARALEVRAPFVVPGFALRLRFGEFASELLSSKRVEPAALLNSGFGFELPQLDAALGAAFRA